MKEEWRPLIGREEMYEVSNLGNFKSKTHIVRGAGYAIAGKPLKTTIAREACKRTGISYKGISRSCRSGYNAGGYKWEFATLDLLQAAIAATSKATS